MRMTARAVFEKFLRVPHPRTRVLSPLVFHGPQSDLIDAFDAVDADGEFRYDEFAALWVKKAGKSETGGGLIIAELVGGTEPDREVIIVAGDKDQGRSYTFASAARFVRRNAWLTNNVRVLKNEIVFTEQVTDPRTGGSYAQDHIARVVAPGAAETEHGGRATLTVFDEFHVHSTFDIVEALARAPNRRARIVYFSYAGLRSQMRDDCPLWSLWKRWKAGTDPKLYVSYIGGPDGWKQVPWISQAFITSQRNQFQHVPAKFARLWQNEWAIDDSGSFLPTAEIQAAIDHSRTGLDATGAWPEAAVGVDLGLSFDRTAIVGSRTDAGRLIVERVEIYRGTPAKPVSLMMVEDRIVAIANALGTRRVFIDRWQAALLSERLTARGLSVAQRTSDPTNLDKWATALRRWFATRAISIPNHAELIEQLEHITGEEMRRRDRVRFTATDGRHDDAVVALVLSGVETNANATIGRSQMAEIDHCAVEAAFGPGAGSNCYLFHGQRVPSDPVCRSCAANVSTRHAHGEYVRRTGEDLDLRMFVQRGLISPNRFAQKRKWNAWLTLNTGSGR
jgi:hypothetical protein